MSTQASGTYISSDDAVQVEVGFVPDRVKLTTAVGGTELVYDWYKVLGDTSAGTGQYGILDTAGVKSTPSTAATGIIALSSDDTGVLIESPQDSGKLIFVSTDDIADWEASTAYTPARSATTVGKLLYPTTRKDFVFELTTAGTSGATEPAGFATAKPGETVTDNTAVWTCREQDVTKRGVNGFQVGVTVCTDGEIHVWTAEKHDVSEDQGDADLTNPVRVRG
jgi:hypothetical protein